MDHRGSRIASWSLGIGTLAGSVATAAVAARTGTAENFAFASAVSGGASALLAAVVLDHRPVNRAARALLAAGVVDVANTALTVWSGLQVRSGEITEWSAVLGAVPESVHWWFLLAFLVLFPDGAPPSRRWWVVLAAHAVVGAALAVLRASLAATDPVAALTFAADLDAPPGPLAPVLFLQPLFLGGTAALGLACLLGRLRTEDGETRRSLRYALSGVACTAVVVTAVVSLPGSPLVLDLLIAAAPLPFLVAVTVAMRRIHQVDRLVRPAVTYAAITVVLLGVYAAVALAVGTLTRSLPVGSPLAASAATLAAAAAFRPVLATVRRAVDRRFDRRAWQATAVLDAYGRRLRAGSAGPDGLLAAVRTALADPTAEVGYVADGRVVDLDGTPRELPGDRLRREVRAGGEVVAVLEVDPRLGREPRLLDAVVAAAALPLENAALHARAAVHLAEVRASRARIVAAGDLERRRIQRDLHDGAQQRLVALALRLRRAQRDADGVGPDLLSGSVAELLATVEELRELTRGILPAALLDEGLEVALHTAAARMPILVRLDVPPGRHPQAVEATAWFFACEGMTNAAKHSGAGAVVVRVRPGAAGLVVEVADDGSGGAVVTPGGGLQGLADRVTAVGGRFRLDSPPGRGTTLTAEVPCGS